MSEQPRFTPEETRWMLDNIPGLREIVKQATDAIIELAPELERIDAAVTDAGQRMADDVEILLREADQ